MRQVPRIGRPGRAAKVLDFAHKTTVLLLLGTSLFLSATIAMNMYNRRQIRKREVALYLESTAHHQTPPSEQ